MPGTSRSSSGMLVRPERWMSSCVMTYSAAATSSAFCSVREAVLTWTFIRSSSEASARSPLWAHAGGAARHAISAASRPARARVMLRSHRVRVQPAEDGVDPRLQHRRIERLQQVVVRAEVEDALLDAGTFFGGEHEDRHRRQRQIATHLA